MTAADFSRYPRDLVGYGRHPPDPRWPSGARVAVQFVVNYEEGGERNTLHGDATSEAFLSDVLGAQPWPDQRHMNVESMYEYGSPPPPPRLARRLLARVASVHRAKLSDDRVRRGDGPGAASRRGRGDARGALGDRQPRPQMDRLQGRAGGRGARPFRRGDAHPHRGDRRASVRLVYRAQFGQHLEGRARRRRLSLLIGFLCG